MVFWGVEVKPGKPFKQTADPFDYTKLHLSQATLGLDVKSKDRVVVKCKVGEGPEILLCSLIPGVVESHSLDLLFDQDVVFSVTGSTPVHLTGYYMPINDTGTDDDYDSEDLDDSTDEESDEDDDDSDAPMVEAPPSGVVIEEIYDDERQEKDKKEGTNAAKKRKQLELVTNGSKLIAAAQENDTSGDDEKDGDDEDDDEDEEESEDEDGFLVPAKRTKGSKAALEQVVKVKAAVQETPKEAPAGKKSKKKAEKPEVTENKSTITEKKATPGEGKKKAGEKVTPAKAPAVKQEEGKSAAAKKPQVRKHPNGLEIHEVAMGKPDGKQAKLGKRVSVYYTGKLKNGKIFDSNVGKKPFLFRLGVGEVIKGWDIGVEGMRVGDKRKLVIPPLLAYGAEGVGNQIPGNSTLTFDVELVSVK